MDTGVVKVVHKSQVDSGIVKFSCASMQVRYSASQHHIAYIYNFLWLSPVCQSDNGNHKEVFVTLACSATLLVLSVVDPSGCYTARLPAV